MSLQVVPMKQNHIADIVYIEQQCFTKPWSAQGVAAELQNPTASFLVLEQQGTAIGYIGIHTVCDEGYIANLAVLPKYRKQGFGKLLLGEAVTLAQNKNLSFLSLEVRPSNLAALGLYRSLGFTLAGKRKNFYTNPIEDGCIMTRFFTNQ